MNQDLIVKNETNKNSRGGTELLQERLYDGSVPRELLEQCQIVFSRVRDLDESKIRIFYAHDLAGDPEADSALLNDGWKRFHKLVFVSNWQMQKYIDRYQIPWSHCLVIPNSIYINQNRTSEDLKSKEENRKIKLIYTSTPHRGLNILYPVFDALFKKYEGVHDLELDVFSSFKLYGWEQRDTEFKDLFDQLRAHPKINYHGTSSNEEVHSALSDAHIFAYPSIWQETSCLCLIEAMTHGLLCVHPNLGALSETAANWTFMYQWDEDTQRHANTFYHVLDNAINSVKTDQMKMHLNSQSVYASMIYNWNRRSNEWTALLSMLINTIQDRSIKKPEELFTYSIGQ